MAKAKPKYQFTMNGSPVEKWVNDRLNRVIAAEYRELYDQCINWLDAVFTPYNATACANCKHAEWTTDEAAKTRPGCGCCIWCANTRGYTGGSAGEKLLLKGIPFDNEPNGKQWGYFNPDTHSCTIPRHLRSAMCLGYFCNELPNAPNRYAVDHIVDAIREIRYSGKCGVSKNTIRRANVAMGLMEPCIHPFDKMEITEVNMSSEDGYMCSSVEFVCKECGATMSVSSSSSNAKKHSFIRDE